MSDQRLGPALLAEGIGTFVIVPVGCGAIALGSGNGLWIYLVAPVIGATVAAFGYERLRRRRAPSASSIP